MGKGLTAATIEHASPVPLYHQVARALEAAIEEGRLPGGSRLDNELSLAEQFGVSRSTMRSAIRELVAKGLLVRKQGIGTTVAAVPIRRPVVLSSLYDDLKKAGRRPTTRVLAFEEVPCTPEVGEVLNLRPGTPVLRFDRLRVADSTPVALMHNAIPAGLLRIASEDLERTGLYELFRRNGVRPHMADQEIGARRAEPEEARLLEIKASDPVLTMRRVMYSTTGRAVEYGWHGHPAASYSFEMVLMDR